MQSMLGWLSAAARVDRELDPQKAAAARFLVVALLASALAVGGYTVASLVVGSAPLHTLMAALTYGIGAVLGFAALRAGRVRLATHLFVFQNWAAAVYFVALEGPNTGHVGIFFIAVILAGLLVGSRPAIGYGLASAAVLISVQAAIVGGVFTPSSSPEVLWLPVLAQIVVAGLLIGTLVRGLHEALADLREHERKLSHLIQNSPDGILFLDSSGRCVAANPAAVTMLGRPLVGAAAAETGLWRETAFDAGSFRNGMSVQQLRLDDGSTRLVELNGIRLEDRGAAASFEFVLRDVTDRVRADEARQALEAKLRRAQKTEALGRLAGGVAHDFNNLLTIILGNAGSLADGPAHDETTREQISEIEQAALRGADVTRQLLTFARKEERGVAAVDVGLVIRGAVRMFERFLGEAVALELVFPERPAVTRIDPVQLEQVLVNLVVNAHDAMPHGGRLTMKVGTLELDAGSSGIPGLPAGRWVELEVSDTGHGMSEELIARAFEPFFTTKPEGQGTGLGLSTVDLIVSRAGGRIKLESRVGEGCRFRLLFPSAEADPALPDGPAAERSPFAGRGEVVCLVEDDERIRKVSERFLEQHGYRVASGPDGHVALAQLAALGAPPGILVTDVVLQHGSGPEVASAFHQLHPNTPVLYVSGYSSGLLAAHGLRSDAEAVLAKPYNGETLARRIRRLLDERALASVTSG